MEEIWKDLVGYEGLYKVSNLGGIKSLPKRLRRGVDGYRNTKELILTPVNSHGYFHVGLSGNGKYKTAKIHRLVAITFIPNPENKPQVNHKNGIKNDNRVENLEWVTAKENIQHSHNNNLTSPPRGSKHHMAISVLDTETGILYGCIADAWRASGICSSASNFGDFIKSGSRYIVNRNKTTKTDAKNY